jgi:biopolymer transport protein ExbD
MFSEARHRDRRARVDMSPLIDIVFLLLIFFAVTTTFLEQSAMDLELPESSTSEATESAQITVEVGADGEIRLQGEIVTAEQLEARVGQLSEEEKARIAVRADTSISLGLTIQVIDALRNGGAEGISLPMVPSQQ